LARGTLGAVKSADGLQAVQWFRAGQIGKVLEYCRQDVMVTRGLYEYGHARQHLKYYDRFGKLKQVSVHW
jgi:DEAD/DEAH box helicase domain-containing protein